jgi:DNA-binding MarR family transcriptional regulator
MATAPTKTTAKTRAGTTETASRLRFAVMRLTRQLRQQSDGTDVSPSGSSALSSLERLGSVTLGRLAAVERVRPPSITKIVDRLEELGFVRREVDPNDRRSSLVHLTEAGTRHIAETRNRKTAYLASRLADLSKDDVALLEAALPVLERLGAEADVRATNGEHDDREGQR